MRYDGSMTTYGRHFAAIYSWRWAFWADRMWPFVQRTLKQRGIARGAWLDLCCGAGSMLRYASRAGFETVGVDLSRAQLAQARKAAPGARLIRANVCDRLAVLHHGERGRTRRDHDTPEAFDVVTCLMDSLNYLTRRADLVQALRNARHCLAPGGVFIFDMNTFEGLRRHWNSQASASNESGHTMIFETHFDERTAIAELNITGFVRAGKLWRRFRETHVERGYTRTEIERALRSGGLRVLDCRNDRFGHDVRSASRLIYVCQTRDCKS